MRYQKSLLFSFICSLFLLFSFSIFTAAKGFIQKHYLAAYDLPSSDLLVDTSAPAHMSLQNSDGLLNPMNPHVARKSSDSSSHASNFSVRIFCLYRQLNCSVFHLPWEILYYIFKFLTDINLIPCYFTFMESVCINFFECTVQKSLVQSKINNWHEAGKPACLVGQEFF